MRRMALRWNFRLGPLQFTSPVGKIASAATAGVWLTCCCGGIVALFTVSPDTPPAPAVKTSTSPTATAKPTPKAKPTPTVKRTTAAPQPKNDPRYASCAKAIDAGYGPYVEGEDPEYKWYEDRDGDGVVCEH